MVVKLVSSLLEVRRTGFGDINLNEKLSCKSVYLLEAGFLIISFFYSIGLFFCSFLNPPRFNAPNQPFPRRLQQPALLHHPSERAKLISGPAIPDIKPLKLPSRVLTSSKRFGYTSLFFLLSSFIFVQFPSISVPLYLETIKHSLF